MTNAIGQVKKFELRKVSKETSKLSRRIEQIGQLFNERIARAEADYRASLIRAVTGEAETPVDPEGDAGAAAVAS